MTNKTEQTEASPAVEIDAGSVQYRELNTRLRKAVASGVRQIVIRNVQGQRYVGTGLNTPMELEVHGHPGNDLGAFIDGPRIIVRGDVEDGCGNTMSSGEIVVHGRAGDILGWSARGGKIFVRDDAGRRAGIRMKGHKDGWPVVVIGGTAQEFLAEYMAGGTLILLGLTLAEGQRHPSSSIGTGMQGGVVYLRGIVEDHQLGKEVGRADLDVRDWNHLRECVSDFAGHFGLDAEGMLKGRFTKLVPVHRGAGGRLYAY